MTEKAAPAASNGPIVLLSIPVHDFKWKIIRDLNINWKKVGIANNKPVKKIKTQTKHWKPVENRRDQTVPNNLP